MFSQGEEIGMTDYNEAEAFDKRDPNRTPMQWDSSKNAGFTNSSKPWLKVNPNFVKKNVAIQETLERSHLHHFRNLASLRKLETFVKGDYFPKTIGKHVFAFVRELKSYPTFAVILNMIGENVTTDMTSFVNLPEKMKVVTAGIDSQHKIG